MSVDPQVKQLRKQLTSVRRIAYAGWTVALGTVFMLFATGAARQQSTRGLIGEVQDLKQRLAKLEKHVHVENGQTVIVADHYYVPWKRGGTWNESITKSAFTPNVGDNGHVAAFGSLPAGQGAVGGSHMILYGNAKGGEFKTTIRLFVEEEHRTHYAGIYLKSKQHADPSEWARYYGLDTDDRQIRRKYEFP